MLIVKRINFWREKAKSLLRKSILKPKISDWLVIIMTVIYSILFSYYTIMRHYSFRSNAWDLGILVQSIASAAQGRLFVNNVELYYSPTGSYFGIHFAPVLFLAVPFFYIAPTVETILILQSAVLAMGAISIYLIVRHMLGDEVSALFLSASYLLNPLLQGINWYDFHTQAFFPLFILLATYFLKKRRTVLYLFFLILSLFTIEQSAYFVISYVPYCLWEMRKEIGKNIRGKFTLRSFLQCSLIPLVTLTAGILWIILSSKVKFTINPSPPPELKAFKGFKYLDISDPAEIPGKLIADPDLALNAFQYEMPKKILYVILTFAPSCFLALLSPIALIPAFLWLLLASLSNWRPYYSLGFQYTAFTLPFVSIATIDALRTLHPKDFDEKLARKNVRKISTIILLVGVFLSIFLSPLSFVHRVGDYEYFRDYGISIPSIMNKQVMRIVARIPKESIVLTTQTIFPHLSTNPNAYTIPPTDYPSPRLYKSHIKYLKNNVRFDYILITWYWNKAEAKTIYEEFIKSNDEFGLLIKGPGLELYQRGYKGSPEKIAIKITYKELALGCSIVVDDPTSEAGKIIILKTSSTPERTAWFGPYIILLPGNYTVKFKIKVDCIKDEKIVDLDVYSKYKGKISSCSICGKDIIKPFMWHTFSISFNIKERMENIEFRGLNVASDITLCLDYIEIIPES